MGTTQTSCWYTSHPRGITTLGSDSSGYYLGGWGPGQAQVLNIELSGNQAGQLRSATS